MDVLISAFHMVFAFDVLGVILLGSAFGLFVGATPGLSATMAVALLVPVTFFLSPVAAIGAIVSCSAMSIFAGDIPGALLRIPGTPASAAYMRELDALNQMGRLDLALGTSMMVAVIGGLIGTAILVVAAPQLAEVALLFSTYEYFWLALLGLSCATLVAGRDRLKGTVSLLLGLFLTMIGLDVTTGLPRYTFGLIDLQAGISLIAVMIGAFAVAEILRSAQNPLETPEKPAKAGLSILRGQGRNLWTHKGAVARGSILGTLIGALPGAGADIAAWIAYAVSQRFSKKADNYGKGEPEAIAGAASANNAALSGSYVPALVFGIPGDSITAIVVGVLVLKGIQPGPMVFITSPDLVNAIYIVFVLANLLIIPLGLLAIIGGRQLLGVRMGKLYPSILLLCVLGTFATNNSLFDLWTLAAVGVLVWIMEANDYPAAPLVLGLVLGRVVEENFMSSMIKADGNLLAFFERPIAGVLGVITLLVWLAPPALALLRRLSGRSGGRQSSLANEGKS
ncbi:tripartite tricarboxylate transporter permease [Salipiger sp. PrR002]|uniref:tripartite tricarboxylate transporter permease n=1 Tax=Salipiger sp. PrR002 TaxID=2706489 RepID=UPI0013BD5CE2|nr:tripartite tricarboxylate transporter permease [Salipiger sp. PrR002]NDW00888.1 tripartite tricarboxylate transporter permease [Salipiger sp. PrR002]NDW57991.1 tripartite tricarboxylate transporter permease [Salipiger sp. PrR004]